MTKPVITLLLLFLSLRLSYAQQASADISGSIAEAEEYILSEDYKEALSILTDLLENGTQNANIYYKTGFCYLQTISEKQKALPLLKKASENVSLEHNYTNPLEENAPVETWLYLGDAYRLNNNFTEAQKCYVNYARLSGSELARKISAKRIRESKIARVLQSRPVDAKWETLPDQINQGLANLNPVTSADGNTLVFTRKMKFYDALFISKKTDGTWQEAHNITTQVGSDGEYYPTALSSDGTRLLLSAYNALTGQDIYESVWTGSRWTKLKKLDEGVNTKFAEINASYAADGKTILFSSNRENGYGGYDIYWSELRADGSWSKAINMGSIVNTPADEKNPHILNNGKTLVFSSEGHFCMGGYDLFYIDYPIQSNSTVKNFGYPISTVLNDLSFYPVQNENAGYIAKYSEEGNAETDIFKTQFTSLSNLFEVTVKTPVEITGLSSGDSIWLFLVDASLNDTIDSKKASDNPGTLDYRLYPGEFKLIAQNNSGMSQSAGFKVGTDKNLNSVQIPLSIAFKKPEAVVAETAKTDSVTFPDFLFDFNSFAINKEYAPLLDDIVTLLNNNPSATLTITGYADNSGEEAYNLYLSEKRALEIVHQINKKGIDIQRLKAVGAGSTNFVAVNSSREGRKYNRRSEFTFDNLPANLIIIKLNNVPENLKWKE